MNNWMTQLSTHYKRTREKYPGDRILIVFDIDGTILDMRYVILHVLKAFDESHGTDYFRDIKLSDIDFHEENIKCLLDRLDIAPDDQRIITEQYIQLFWSSAAALEAHRPFRGVLEVIRWFQMQPLTYVALNTGRPESLRMQTLQTLNRLAGEYRVNFSDPLLYMKPDGSDRSIPEVKADGIMHFTKEGYRVCAVVDNEPDNLYAISQVDPGREILLLHADTIFKSKQDSMPQHAVKGRQYDFAALIRDNIPTRHTKFVWHCAYDSESFYHFLESNIHWMQLDMRLFMPSFRRLSMTTTVPDLELCMDLLKRHDKKVKFLLYEGGQELKGALDAVSRFGFDDAAISVDVSVAAATHSAIVHQLKEILPRAAIQCPVDFLADIIVTDAARARNILENIRSQGINRFSVNWMQPKKRKIIIRLIQWGYEVDIHHVFSLESFLRAVLLAPFSITSHFNFLDRERSMSISFRHIA